MTIERYVYEATLQDAANLAVEHVLKVIGVEGLDAIDPTKMWQGDTLAKARIGDEDIRITSLRYDIAFAIGEATYGLSKAIEAHEEAASKAYDRDRPDKLTKGQLV